MKTPAFIVILSLFVLLATVEAQKKCKCRGKRGPRGLRGPKGKTGPPGPGAGGANCKLLFDSSGEVSIIRKTGELNFAIPQLAVTASCPTDYTTVSCDCHINSSKNGREQVRTKIIGWGRFTRFCICNFEYLPGFSEEVDLSVQAHCVKLDCS